MTLVAAMTCSFDCILIADSRLTWGQSSSSDRHGDVRQKVVRLGNEGLVGFAGDVKTAHTVVRLISGTYQKRGLRWVNSDSEFCERAQFIPAKELGSYPIAWAE